MLPIPGNKLCPVPPKIKGAFESVVVVVVLAAIAASTFLSPAFLPSLKVFFLLLSFLCNQYQSYYLNIIFIKWLH